MLHIDLTPYSVADQVLLSACRLIGVFSYVNCPASHENVTWFLKTKACFCGIAAAPGMGPWRLQYISANDLLIVTEVKPGPFLCRMLSQHAASSYFPQKNNFFWICSFFVSFLRAILLHSLSQSKHPRSCSFEWLRAELPVPSLASLTDVALFLVPHSPVRFPLDQYLWLLQKQMLWTSRGRASWLPLWQPVQELQQLLLRLWWAVLKDRYDGSPALHRQALLWHLVVISSGQDLLDKPELLGVACISSSPCFGWAGSAQPKTQPRFPCKEPQDCAPIAPYSVGSRKSRGLFIPHWKADLLTQN